MEKETKKDGNEIATLKKQVRWLSKMVNNLIGNDETYSPIVKFHKGSTDPNSVDSTNDIVKSHDDDSCYDICAHFPSSPEAWESAIEKNPRLAVTKEAYDDTTDSVRVYPGKTLIVPTNISLELPKNFECQCRPRSGLTSEGKLVGWGTVDEGYRGDIGIIVTNSTTEVIHIKNNTRVAQLAFVRKSMVKVECADGEVSETSRGAAGFGSTGTEAKEQN